MKHLQGTGEPRLEFDSDSLFASILTSSGHLFPIEGPQYRPFRFKLDPCKERGDILSWSLYRSKTRCSRASRDAWILNAEALADVRDLEKHPNVSCQDPLILWSPDSGTNTSTSILSPGKSGQPERNTERSHRMEATWQPRNGTPPSDQATDQTQILPHPPP